MLSCLAVGAIRFDLPGRADGAWEEGQTPRGRTWTWALELIEELRSRGADQEHFDLF